MTRLTRVKSQIQRSLIDDKQTVPTMGETDISTVYLNLSSTDLYNNNNMKTPSIEGLKNDVDRSQFSQSALKKHLVESINQVPIPSAFPLTEKERVISNYYKIISIIFIFLWQ